MCGRPQIRNPIVTTVAIFMINLWRRLLAIIMRPRQSVGKMQPSIKPNYNIFSTAGARKNTPGLFADLYPN